jgi:hypothetical protein
MPSRQVVRLRIVVPDDAEAVWSAIRKHDVKSGTFTITELAESTGLNVDAVREYVRLLRKAAIVVDSGKPGFVYKLVQRPARAPRFDGRSAEENLWTAMRSLKRFTVDELLFAARTDGNINRVTALNYLNRLRAAGFFSVARTPGKAGLQTWFLKPAMNHGPKPPTIMQVSFVWDGNARRMVGEHDVTEVRI